MGRMLLNDIRGQTTDQCQNYMEMDTAKLPFLAYHICEDSKREVILVVVSNTKVKNDTLTLNIR